MEFFFLMALMLLGGFFFGWGYAVLGREDAVESKRGWWLYAAGFLCAGVMAIIVLA